MPPELDGGTRLPEGAGGPDRPPEAGRPPSVDAVARRLGGSWPQLPQPLLVEVARAAIAAGREDEAELFAAEVSRSLLQPALNATGVLLHTNLGRAPIEHHVAARATNLELDLATGRRGSRQAHAGALLARLAGAEDAIVVNNGAAAVLLVLAALAPARPVLVSRGELVEIGGGFRIPEVLAASGSRLVEVGTTNRTRRSDYAAALAAEPECALVLKVHQSNYRIVGFTEAASVAELAALGPPVVVDLGSGLLDAGTPWLRGGPPAWLAGEPAARQTLEQGAALVTFSGDKLLGGPQAGVIAGRRDLVAACARHPLARALRPGGLVLSALQETALAYLRRDVEAIPFWRMATVPVDALRERAELLAAKVGLGVRPVACTAVAGAGSLPGLELPSYGLAAAGDHRAALRRHDPAVVARLRDGTTLCDLRSVDPSDDLVLADALRQALGA